MKKFILNSTLIAMAFTFSIASSQAAAKLQEGDKAPDFELKGSDGESYRLSDFKGKKAVVIAWFPKAFTGGCTKECKSLRDHSQELKAYEVAYFTASCDDAKTNADFAKSLDLDYPILSDPTKKTAQAYGVVDDSRPYPQRWTFYIGKDGKILKIDDKVKTDSHGQDIAATLDELGVPKK